MSRNYYSELHIHVVWHTLDSRPLLTPSIEPAVHEELRRRCYEIPGLIVHAIDGDAGPCAFVPDNSTDAHDQ